MLEKYKLQQPIAYKILNANIKKNRISHAYLFDCTNGQIKSSIIYDFIKMMICPSDNYSNCKKCNICNKIDKNEFCDFTLIEPEGTIIKKQQILNLQKEFSFKNSQGKRKVYLIDFLEKMNSSAANTMLKFLEEPEDNITAILVTYNINEVLDTLKSRCQIIKINKEEELKKIEFDKFNCTDDLKYIQFINFMYMLIIKKRCFSELIYYLKNNVFNDDNYEFKFNMFIFLFKEMLNMKTNFKKNLFFMENKNNEFNEIFEFLTISKIIIYIKILIKYKEKLKYNVNKNLLLDVFLIEMMGD